MKKFSIELKKSFFSIVNMIVFFIHNCVRHLQMADVDALRQWISDVERVLVYILQVEICLLLIKARFQGAPSFIMHPRASDLLFTSMFVYWLSCGISLVSRGFISFAAYWVAAVFGLLMLASVSYIAYA